MVLSSLLQVTLLWAGGWTRRSPEVPSHLSNSVSLYCVTSDFLHCIHPIALDPLNVGDLLFVGKLLTRIDSIYVGGNAVLFPFYDTLGIDES